MWVSRSTVRTINSVRPFNVAAIQGRSRPTKFCQKASRPQQFRMPTAAAAAVTTKTSGKAGEFRSIRARIPVKVSEKGISSATVTTVIDRG
jgi:hypothetical protein